MSDFSIVVTIILVGMGGIYAIALWQETRDQREKRDKQRR